MKENQYWNNAIYFKRELLKYVETIFQVYSNELELKIEEQNLLTLKDNCISSSTAIGFCVEEFIASKLIAYTKIYANKKYDNKIFIQRDSSITTQNSSYDFFSVFKNELYLVNVKVVKRINDAIASISQLYYDYVVNKPNFIKHFFILKIHYKIKNSKIIIKNVNGFFLEEINFKNNYIADNRNWSKEFNKNSGRIQVSKSFLNNNKKEIMEISYLQTYDEIKKIFLSNKNNNK